MTELEENIKELDLRLKKIENALAPKAFMTCMFKEHDENLHGPRGQWFRTVGSQVDHTCKCGYSGMYSDQNKYDQLPKGTLEDF
jgi:hypothetical protein